MRKTLLAIVQDILNDMDSDNVNSIMDTIESEQVAQIVRSTYEAMIANRDWPHLHRLVEVNHSGTPDRPTHMVVQQEIKQLLTLFYNKAKRNDTRKLYQPVHYVEPDEFLIRSNALNTDNPNVEIVTDPSGVEIQVYNNTAPTYFTSFDDKTLVFNSYDREVDDALQSSKIQARAVVQPVWSHRDDFVPDLPSHAFPALIEEAKSRAMIKLKQMEDPKAEQEARRQQRWLSRNSWRVSGGIKYPNYGRKSRKSRRDPTFDRTN